MVTAALPEGLPFNGVSSSSSVLSLLESSRARVNFSFCKVTTCEVAFVASGDLNEGCFFLDFLFLRVLVGEDAVASIALRCCWLAELLVTDPFGSFGGMNHLGVILNLLPPFSACDMYSVVVVL